MSASRVWHDRYFDEAPSETSKPHLRFDGGETPFWDFSRAPTPPILQTSQIVQADIEPSADPVAKDYAAAEPRAAAPQESDMDDMTKEWVNAKLEAVEARNEAKLATIDAKLDLVVSRLDDVQRIAKEARDAAVSVKWNFLWCSRHHRDNRSNWLSMSLRH